MHFSGFGKCKNETLVSERRGKKSECGCECGKKGETERETEKAGIRTMRVESFRQSFERDDRSDKELGQGQREWQCE